MSEANKSQTLVFVLLSLCVACVFFLEHQRHAPTILFFFFVVGCAIVGMPVARQLQDGLTVEIRRGCTDGTRNACSFLYRVCVRIANAMGYRRVLTYTLESESGASLRGAGFKVTKRTRAEHWSRDGRPRTEQPLQHKFRWEAA